MNALLEQVCWAPEQHDTQGETAWMARGMRTRRNVVRDRTEPRCLRARLASPMRTSSEQVHQDRDDSLLAAMMACPRGFMLPCGEKGLSTAWMSTQHTK